LKLGVNSAKKKIIFDVTVLVSGQVSGDIHKTGLYRFSYEVLAELIKLDYFQIFLFDIFHREREVRKYIQPLFYQCERINVYSSWYRLFIFPVGDLTDKLRSYQNSHHSLLFRRFSGFVKNILLLFEKGPRLIERKFFINSRLIKGFNSCRLYFSTYYPIPQHVRENQSIEKVYTVHDIIPILHPTYFSSSFNERILKEVIDSITREDFVISVSESTKRDILNYRKDLSGNQIIVSLLGASEKFYKVTDIHTIEQFKIKYKINCEKYILSVCTIEPRKNIAELIKAFKWLLDNIPGLDLKLVLIGSTGWSSVKLFEDIEEINSTYQSPIVLTGFVPDEDLAALYSGALMFVYPSLYEGFGLPVLEAMQCGLPVISSNVSSLPEVVGDSGLLIDPSDNVALVKAILTLYNNAGLRQAFIEKSLARAKNYSWEKATIIIAETLIRNY
jgi:glycosyltransferase involved in cell wall biosynthesis